MENTNAVSIPLVDILSEIIGCEVVMSGDSYVKFNNLEGIDSQTVEKAEELRISKIKNIQLHKKVQESKNYLASTDWYYARKAEAGEEVPVEVVTKRVEAREFIRNNK